MDPARPGPEWPTPSPPIPSATRPPRMGYADPTAPTLTTRGKHPRVVGSTAASLITTRTSRPRPASRVAPPRGRSRLPTPVGQIKALSNGARSTVTGRSPRWNTRRPRSADRSPTAPATPTVPDLTSPTERRARGETPLQEAGNSPTATPEDPTPPAPNPGAPTDDHLPEPLDQPAINAVVRCTRPTGCGRTGATRTSGGRRAGRPPANRCSVWRSARLDAPLTERCQVSVAAEQGRGRGSGG